MEPERAQERQKVSLLEEFAKKHARVLKRAAEVEEQLESQEELIRKLNDLHSQKNEALLSKQEGS